MNIDGITANCRARQQLESARTGHGQGIRTPARIYTPNGTGRFVDLEYETEVLQEAHVQRLCFGMAG